MQLAGVECAGNTHFWVNDDGSYQEEGQKNTKGYIWGKVCKRKKKIFCLGLGWLLHACSHYVYYDFWCYIYRFLTVNCVFLPSRLE